MHYESMFAWPIAVPALIAVSRAFIYDYVQTDSFCIRSSGFTLYDITS